jgi:tetratricopeptide (TPR) repeat protein
MRLNRKLGAALLLAVAGVAKLPLEERFSADLRARHLLQETVGLDMRESLGQMGFAASLGGLRSLVASITYLQAYAAFEDTDWGKVDSLMTVTTRLQPRDATYWDEASWHQAYNAASSDLRNTKLRAAIRSKLFRDHVERGIEILQEGLRYLPNDPRLLAKLGMIYADRQQDHRKAADAFLKAYQNGGGAYFERRAAYELVKLNEPEADRKAYAILKRCYDQGMRLKGTTIMTDLSVLEDRLKIPQEQRAKAEDREMPRKAR